MAHRIGPRTWRITVYDQWSDPEPLCAAAALTVARGFDSFTFDPDTGKVHVFRGVSPSALRGKDIVLPQLGWSFDYPRGVLDARSLNEDALCFRP